MTSKLTRERLQEIAEDGFLKHGESKELARMALAAMNSEPVAYMHDGEDGTEYNGHNEFSGGGKGIPLYRHAQPVPVVPPEVGWEDVPEEITEDNMEVALAWAHGFNQCRAAMLHAGTLTNEGTIQAVNSPVIPDGWKLVPIEPNGDMLAAAQDAYGETEGDIASTLRAAIAAAQQEVNHG